MRRWALLTHSYNRAYIHRCRMSTILSPWTLPLLPVLPCWEWMRPGG